MAETDEHAAPGGAVGGVLRLRHRPADAGGAELLDLVEPARGAVGFVEVRGGHLPRPLGDVIGVEPQGLDRLLVEPHPRLHRLGGLGVGEHRRAHEGIERVAHLGDGARGRIRVDDALERRARVIRAAHLVEVDRPLELLHVVHPTPFHRLPRTVDG